MLPVPNVQRSYGSCRQQWLLAHRQKAGDEQDDRGVDEPARQPHPVRYRAQHHRADNLARHERQTHCNA
jgi:hypothetical protein